MDSRPTTSRLAWAVATAAAWLFAAWVVVDTLRTILPLWSPLPWFDEWATFGLLRAWQEGDLTAAQVLFSQHNEHRILVPRLVFFADDFLFGGGGQLSLAAILAVQTLHAGLFAAVLGRARPPRSGRWAVAAVVLALMFSLRQADNFASGFQLAFVAVFAGATLSALLFGLVVSRERAGRPVASPLAASFLAVLLTSFTMANGLVAGFVLVAMALAGRMPRPVVVACAAWAAVLTLVYLPGYQTVGRPSDCLRQPLDLLFYVATYLGGIVTTERISSAAMLGGLGLAATLLATLRVVLAARPRPTALALWGVMLFIVATATVTASGRVCFGVVQALSSRYATGSAVFWAAQLTYWWVEPPAWPARLRPALTRGAVAVVAMVLCVAMVGGQGGAKPQLYVQSFARNEGANLLMLGLRDPATVRRTAWIDQEVQDLLPTLEADRLSIFGTSEAMGVGHPVAERGALASPESCGGTVTAAIADPALGPGGVRLAGLGWDGPDRHLVRRILVADPAGLLVGFGSGAIPAAGRSDWRGFAVAPAGTILIAYGVLPGDRLCRIGDATVGDAPRRGAMMP